MSLRQSTLRIKGVFLMAVSATAQTPKGQPLVPHRYTLILADAPVAQRFAARNQVRSAAAGTYRSPIVARQAAARARLAQLPRAGNGLHGSTRSSSRR
jgi:hypothetical protein